MGRMRAVARLLAQPRVRLLLGLSALVLGALLVTRLATQQRLPPARCPAGMVLTGPRCCGSGQSSSGSACVGKASSCSALQNLSERGDCVARFGVVRLGGGALSLGAADWEGASQRERFPDGHVAPFRLDVGEVTLGRWSACVAEGACPARAGDSGLPVTHVGPGEAEAFCQRSAGRLPTAAEWVFAAAGEEARRFAWGGSGLVCRRAAFGLVRGPCADGGSAELSGSRLDGASPEGIFDLAGNVAEWAREPGGDYAARGGSFRSETAAELKSWSVQATSKAAAHIGFRCAYPP